MPLAGCARLETKKWQIAAQTERWALKSRKESTYARSLEPAWKEVVKPGWKMVATSSDAKMVAGSTKERGVRELAQES